MQARDFLTTESGDGRFGFLLIYGVVGTVAAWLLLPLWALWIVLPLGAGLGGLIAWRTYGPVRVWFDGHALVQESGPRTRELDLRKCGSVEAASGFKSPPRLVLRERNGRWMEIAIVDSTEVIRHEIGRRLRANTPAVLGQVGPSTLKALGLH